MHKIHIFDEAFFFVATVGMMTVKVIFSSFHSNHFKGKKCFHHNYAAYESKLSLKKMESNRERLLKKIAVKEFLLLHEMSENDLLNIPSMASLDILC